MNSLKVAELYDMVTANQAVATALPDVVDRLDSLQALHEQANSLYRSCAGSHFFGKKHDIWADLGLVGNNDKTILGRL